MMRWVFTYKQIVSATVLLLLAWSDILAADDPKPNWLLDISNSRLQFIFDQAGSKQSGEFKAFDTEFWMDWNNLSQSHFDVRIDIRKLDTAESERDQILRSADMFDAEKWPAAGFRAFNIRRLDGDQYLADAELTIRDVTKKLVFPFKLQLSEDGRTFTLQSQIAINRLEYGVGQADWAVTTWVADTVKVSIDVAARKVL